MGTLPKIGDDDYLQDSTSVVTTSSEEVSLPSTNLLSSLRTKVWRATGDTSEWVKVDLGSARAVSLICIFNHNFTSGATITVEANATDVWTSPSYSQVISHDDDVLILVDAVAAHDLPQTFRWWRVTIEDASNPDGYVEAGIWYLGSYFEFQRDWQGEFAYQPVDPAVIKRSYDRQKSVDLRSKYDVVGWTVNGLTQFAEMRALLETVGVHQDVPLVLDSNDKTLSDGLHDLTYWGAFASYGGLNPWKNLFNFDFSFEEST